MLLTVAAALVQAPPATAQPPAPGRPVVLDGPSGAISRPVGLAISIARDGTGGLVYLKAANGRPHVFVSRMVGGALQPPAQVDGQLAGASSQPVIAAGNGGLLLVGFINGGQLYVVDGNGVGQFVPPIHLASGALNPAISITNFGKAYLAFAAADHGGHDVRTAYYYNGSWALEAPPLNAIAGDDAGTGRGRPDVAAAGDGIAIVAWGEHGHIYSRRVWGTAASFVYEQADAPPGGCSESSADEPAVGAGGDSSYAPVAFHAVLICGGQQQSRVLVNRLHGSVYDGIAEADGLSPAPNDGATDPQVAVTEYGAGWVTSAGTTSDGVFGALLGANGVFAGGAGQINGLAGSVSPFPVPAIAGLHSTLIAWQQEPGSTPGGEIRVRFAPDGVKLGPETVLSSPAQGPLDAADGLAAAGDISGDAAIAWLQGAAGATQLMVNELYQPPGGFGPSKAFAYARTPQPVLAWTRPRGWGPIGYALSVDAAQVSQTFSSSAQVPLQLADGPHIWQVTASNPAGQQSRAPVAEVFVDTVAPTATLRLLDHARVGSKLRMAVRYADHPPAGEPRFDASGVITVVIRWGDGSVLRVRRGTRLASHRYRRPGRYRIVVLVSDRAGNVTRAVKLAKVVKVGHGRGASTGGRP